MVCHGWRAECSPRSEIFPSQGHWCLQLRLSSRLPHPNQQVHRSPRREQGCVNTPSILL